jgi:hypothetical protein
MARLPVPHQVSEKAAEITSRAALSSAVQKGADRGNAVVPRPLHLICIGRLIQANAYNGHVTIAVALVGAAITIGLTIWESQKGKKRGPVIIDVQFVSHRQR